MSVQIHSKGDFLKEFARINPYIEPNLNLKRFLEQFKENELHTAFDQLVAEKILEKREGSYFMIEP